VQAIFGFSMKAEIKTPVLVAIAVVVVAVAAFFLLNAIGNAGNLDQGQVQYTPGKPPWEETDPNKKGPGGAPGGGGPGAGKSQPVQGQPYGTQPGAGGPPPGMTAPQIGGNK
jgi:hypothetical protein